MIKIDKADQYFSYYIREKADWKCARCMAQHERKSQGLHCSHFFGRRAESTRFDEDNVDAHCHGCHSYLGSNPKYFTEWKERQLGQQGMQRLIFNHNQVKKKDRKMEAIKWKEALKQLCEIKGVDFSIFVK